MGLVRARAGPRSAWIRRADRVYHRTAPSCFPSKSGGHAGPERVRSIPLRIAQTAPRVLQPFSLSLASRRPPACPIAGEMLAAQALVALVALCAVAHAHE